MGIETGRLGPDPHERVVHDVLGQCPLANQAQGHGQQAPALALIQTLQRLTIATSTLLQGDFVIEWIFRQGHERPPWQVEE